MAEEHPGMAPEVEEDDHDEQDVKEEDELEAEEEEAGEGASSACEGLPTLPGDTPSGGQSVIAKLLISNAAAGSVIGKVSPLLGNRLAITAPPLLSPRVFS